MHVTSPSCLRAQAACAFFTGCFVDFAGFCAVSKELPLRATAEAEVSLTSGDNGMNAQFDETVHCVAAEPECAEHDCKPACCMRRPQLRT